MCNSMIIGTMNLKKSKIIKGKDWRIEIFPSGSMCWTFPDNAGVDRINECIKEMNKAVKEKYYDKVKK